MPAIALNLQRVLRQFRQVLQHVLLPLGVKVILLLNSRGSDSYERTPGSYQGIAFSDAVIPSSRRDGEHVPTAEELLVDGPLSRCQSFA